MNVRQPHSWVDTDNADNSAATATKAAAGGALSHYITSVSGGYDATVSGADLILKHGTTEVARWQVYDSFSLSFSSPIQLPPNTVANLVLDASGTGGTVGSVTMTGYTL